MGMVKVWLGGGGGGVGLHAYFCWKIKPKVCYNKITHSINQAKVYLLSLSYAKTAFIVAKYDTCFLAVVDTSAGDYDAVFDYII